MGSERAGGWYRAGDLASPLPPLSTCPLPPTSHWSIAKQSNAEAPLNRSAGVPTTLGSFPTAVLDAGKHHHDAIGHQGIGASKEHAWAECNTVQVGGTRGGTEYRVQGQINASWWGDLYSIRTYKWASLMTVSRPGRSSYDGIRLSVRTGLTMGQRGMQLALASTLRCIQLAAPHPYRRLRVCILQLRVCRGDRRGLSEHRGRIRRCSRGRRRHRADPSDPDVPSQGEQSIFGTAACTPRPAAWFDTSSVEEGYPCLSWEGGDLGC